MTIQDLPFYIKTYTGAYARGLSTDMDSAEYALYIPDTLFSGVLPSLGERGIATDGSNIYHLYKLSDMYHIQNHLSFINAINFDPFNLIQSNKQPRLEAFWKEYGPVMAEMYPLYTYYNTTQVIGRYIQMEKFDIAIYLAGSIISRIDCNRILDACRLNNKWRDLYTKTIQSQISHDEIKKAIYSVYDDSVVDYYKSLPQHTDLEYDIHAVLNSVLL